MAKIPAHIIKQIEDRSLGILEFPEGHVFPDGIRVVEHLCEEELSAGEFITVGKGASVILYSQDGERWYIDCINGAGGFLPADFVNVWTSVDMALADLIDFYSPDSIRRTAKEFWRKNHKQHASTPFVPADILERLEQLGIVETARYDGHDGAFQIGLSQASDAEPRPEVRLSGWTNGVCSVGTRTTENLREIHVGEFWHVWWSFENAYEDIVDFFQSDLRKRAWFEGRQYESEFAESN